MGNNEVHKLQQRVDATFKFVKELGFESEAQGHFTRYLCVLASGYLEASIQILLGEYALRNAPGTSRFVHGRLKAFQNAKMGKILELLGEFDPAWRSEVEQMDEKVKSSVDSVVNLRNQIAHGGFNANVSYATLSDYYKEIKRLVTKLDSLCGDR